MRLNELRNIKAPGNELQNLKLIPEKELKNIKEYVQKKVLAEIDFTDNLSDEDIQEIIDREIIRLDKSGYNSLAFRKKLRKEIFYSIRKLDILQELLDTPEITEIMINGTDNIFVEKNGRLYPHELHFETKEKLNHVIQQIVAACNRTVNEAAPIVDARLENGARVNVVLQPVALNGPIVTIRRFPQDPITMADLIGGGSITKEVAGWLRRLVEKGCSIIVSGGTGSGKTTFLNVLSNYIPSHERIITIEDSAELQIRNIPNLVKLETRGANVEGCREITIRDLIKTSLRMRPSRIIVGEVRGGEAIDLLQAMNTGHAGSMSTIHANSAKDMLSRLETMVLMGSPLPLAAIRKQIVSGVNLIIQLGRLRDNTRRVVEIAEIIGMKREEIQIIPLYRLAEIGEDQNGKIIGTLEKQGELQNELFL